MAFIIVIAAVQYRADPSSGARSSLDPTKKSVLTHNAL
jgi:hypothetical protein